MKTLVNKELVQKAAGITNEVSQRVASFPIETFNQDFIENLQSIDDIVDALKYDIIQLTTHIREYQSLDMELQKILSGNIVTDGAQEFAYDHENTESVVECDENGNFHCGKCLVGYNFCQYLIGKKVVISDIVDNTNPYTNIDYPFFAKRVKAVK